MANNDRQTAPSIAIIAATAFWGLSFVSTKTLLDVMRPLDIALLRHVLATIAIWIVAAISKSRTTIDRRDLPGMTLAAVIGIPVYFMLENTAMLYIPAALASIVTASTPAMTALLEQLLRGRTVGNAHGRSLPARSWAGIAVSAAGVALVVRAGAAEPGMTPGYFKGIALILGSSFSWSVYTILNGPYANKYGVVTSNVFQITLATVMLWVMAAIRGLSRDVVVAAFTAKAAFNLIYLGVICSALSYVLYLFALSSLGPTTVSAFINLVPVFGVAGSAVILGERLSWIQLVGATAVIGGIFIVTRADRSDKSIVQSDRL